jgi:hypothetical protein
MALTMRPTGPSSPAYKDDFDFVIYDDDEAVGRIYEIGGIGLPPGASDLLQCCPRRWRRGVSSPTVLHRSLRSRSRPRCSLAVLCGHRARGSVLRPQRSGGCSMLRAARWCGRRALADKTRRADASTWYPGARSLANLPTPRGQPPELRLDGDLARRTILYRPRMASRAGREGGAG